MVIVSLEQSINFTLEQFEVKRDSDRVKFRTLDGDYDAVIVPVQVFAVAVSPFPLTT